MCAAREPSRWSDSRLRLACLLGLLVAACAPGPGVPGPGVPGPGGTTRLLAAVGDSYASGQGAPNHPIRWWRWRPDWDDRRCNRSKYAGARQARDLLQADFPLDVIQFASFACSGASIERGLLGSYRGTEPDSPTQPLLAPQIDEIRTLNASQPVDALAITIGGNDIMFEHVAAACILAGCSIIDPLVELRIHDLRRRLGDLAAAIALTGIAPARVFLLEYPDPTHEAAGVPCDRKPWPDPLAGITKCEARWASECVLPKLNYELCRIAQAQGWTYVGGIASPFLGHGWCASDRWINTINGSMEAQGHFRGGIHPNRRGYERIAQPLATAVAAAWRGLGPSPTICTPPPPPSEPCTKRCGVAMLPVP